MNQELIKKTLPQNPEIEVYVSNYKEPILPVNHGGFGWYGLLAYDNEGRIMCHICGTFWDCLGGHISVHGLTAKEYKKQAGLLLRRGLVSSRLHEKKSIIAKNRVTDQLRDQCRALPRKGVKGHVSQLELYNRMNTCPSQLLRALSGYADIYGDAVSVSQIRSTNATLVGRLQERFGSFNKAKQLLKLSINKGGSGAKIEKRLILEDICSFYRKEGRWPSSNDYKTRRMICSDSCVYVHYKTISEVVKEAEDIYREQEKWVEIGKAVGRKTQEIEMEVAGRARK